MLERVLFTVIMIGLIAVFAMVFLCLIGYVVIAVIDYMRKHFRKNDGGT